VREKPSTFFVVDFLEEATVLQGKRGFDFLMEYVILTLWVYGVWV
jgi:hypothetical protein